MPLGWDVLVLQRLRLNLPKQLQPLHPLFRPHHAPAPAVDYDRIENAAKRAEAAASLAEAAAKKAEMAAQKAEMAADRAEKAADRAEAAANKAEAVFMKKMKK